MTTMTIRRLEEPHRRDPRCSRHGCGKPSSWIETITGDMVNNSRWMGFYPLCYEHASTEAWAEAERLVGFHSHALNSQRTTREERIARYGEIAAALALYDAIMQGSPEQEAT